MLSNQKHSQYFNQGQKPSSIFVDRTQAVDYEMLGIKSGAEQHSGRLVDRRPSKLEQMRSDFQKKIMKEKQEKMIMMYEEHQGKAIERAIRAGNDGYSGNNSGKSVREFFYERRRLEAIGAPVPPIDNHYRQVKGYISPGGWSRRSEKGNSLKAQKISAGRDRSQPLVPIIQRPLDTQETSNTNNHRSGIPQRHNNTNNDHQNTHRHDKENPFNDKPRLVKHKPLPPTNGHTPQEEVSQRGTFKETQAKYSPQCAKPTPHQQRRQFQPQHQYDQKYQQRNQHGYPADQSRVENDRDSIRFPNKGQDQQKMTYFQKWQMEQNKVRGERLKKFNAGKQMNPRIYEDGEEYDGQYDDHNREDDGVDDYVIAIKEKEIMEKIARQQAELKRMQKNRQEEEEEEIREKNKQKKKEAIERTKQKKIEEEDRKEEERRRKQDEEDETLDRQREENRRKEMEKQKKEVVSRIKEEDKLLINKQNEEEKGMRQEAKQAKLSSHKEYYDESPDLYGQQYSVRKAPQPDSGESPRKQAGKEPNLSLDDCPMVSATADYYAQAAMSSDAKGSVGNLSRCRLCGRQFVSERLQKHEDACAKLQKPRKEFDASKKRVEGTDLAKYAGKSRRPEPPKKKSNWRATHEEFIESLRYAKKITQLEKEGADIRSLPPPPKSKNLDFVSCPHCGRTFNETAADRHIPRCKDLKTRPPPRNTRRR